MKKPRWLFLTNHAHALVCLLREPDITLPRIAAQVGISRRAVQTIVNDLVMGGYVERTRVGRRNHYEPRLDQPLRHALHASVLLQEVIEPLLAPKLVLADGPSKDGTSLADNTRAAIRQSRDTLEAGRRLLDKAKSLPSLQLPLGREQYEEIRNPSQPKHQGNEARQMLDEWQCQTVGYSPIETR